MKLHTATVVAALSFLIAPVVFAAPAVEADLLAAYAPSYAASNGGEDNTEVLIANTVAGNNAMQDQDGTGASIRIVGFYQSINDPVNATTTGGMVGWLANNDSHVADVVSQGAAAGADLVIYICQNSDSSSIAAVSQQPGMYGAYNPGNVWSAVFAHETGGHNYGDAHADGLLNPKTIMLHNYCGGGAAPPYFYTSPNIWFNGVRLLGDGNNCGQGALIHGGDNAWGISSAAQGVADRRSRILVGPSLNNVVLRWSFTNASVSAPAGTVIPDLIAGSNAVVRGIGASFTGKALRIPGGTTGNTAASSIAAYIDLPNGILSSQTNITIEIWATPLSTPNWSRIMDFGRTVQAGDGLGASGEWTGTPGTPAPGTTSGSDEILLSAAIGTDINSQRFETRLNGGVPVTLDSGLPTTPGVQHHYAITFADGAGAYGAAGGRWQWYRDGNPVGNLDVSYHLSLFEDVNNWLGRSLWSADNMANNDYAEVRISNIAMSPGKVLANFLLGPNYFPAANVTLSASDAIGATSFNAVGHWSSGAAPSAGNKYETYDYLLRTPATASPYTFAGDALTISGGSLLWRGTASSAIAINNFTLNGGSIANAGSGTFTLAGNLKFTNDCVCNSVNGPTTLGANLSGNGSITYLQNNTTLTGNNSAFTGKTLVGCGVPGNLTIDSEARLGPNPITFTADQLTLNRGWFYTTTTMSVSNANRGIRIGVSGGVFNVAAGTTLTLAVPVSSPAMPANTIAGLWIKDGSGNLFVTSPNNTHVGPMHITAGIFNLSGAGRLGSGSFAGPIENDATFVYSSSAAQTLSGVISGAGTLTKSGIGILTLSGANTMTGPVIVSGGRLYANPGNAANHRAFSYVSSIMVAGGATLQSSANGLFGWDGTQEHPITVNAGGTLTANGGSASDVGVGTVTLAGGTLATLAGGATDYGSWRFDDATDNLIVTQDSAVSALNVKFGNPAAHIEVSSGKTLSFSGTISDATSGGISYLTVSNGSGIVTLTGTNTYSGGTTLNSGTLQVNGSIGNSAVTVFGGTLGGNGSIGGPITVQPGGTLSPGAGIGKLTVNNSVRLAGTTLMEISAAGPTNDSLVASGTLTFGGTLVVTNLGSAPVLGETFQLFIAAGFASSFTTMNLPSLNPGLAWNFNPTTGVLSVVQSVATNPISLAFSSSANSLTLAWPTDHIGWHLQSQTNSLGTNWFDVPGSASTNTLSLPIDLNSSSAFFRLIYP